jgi:translation initiation factor 3 subunit M
MATCGDLFGGDMFEEDMAGELANHIQTLKAGESTEEMTPYTQKVAELNDAGSFPELLDVFIPDMPCVFKTGSEDDVIGSYSILYALCRKMSEKDQADYTTKLVNSVNTETGELVGLRLKLLVNLYNSVHPTYGKIRFGVFLALVDYCTKTDQVAKVAKHLGDVEGRVSAWKLSLAEQKEVYLKLAAATKCYQDGALAQQFLVKYLGLWAGKGEDLAAAVPQAIEASVTAIQNPTAFDCDELLQLPPVAALATGDAKSKAVHRLLEIYSSEKLDAYETFAALNKELLGSIGLTHEMCVDKLRMLSMASLAAEMGDIPYDRVKATLKLESDKEVEQWVIKVHRAGLVQTKMDQLQRRIIVNRTTARVLSTTDWQELRKRVDGWKQCLDNMSQIIVGAKESAVQGV